MLKKFGLMFLLSLLVMLVPAHAQTEAEMIGRAERLVRNVVPSVGNLNQWQYISYVMTNDGSLGCPLATSYNLGYSVVPWRVRLTFSNGLTYVVYVSSDPNVSVLCDSKLLATTPTTTTTNTTPVYTPTCSATPVVGSRGPIYTAPNSGTLIGYLDLFGSISVVGRSTDTAWYQVQNSSLFGWISIYDVLLNGAGCSAIGVTSNVTTPITTTPTDYVGLGVGGPVSCFLSAVYANVRTLPSLNGAIVEQVSRGQIYGVTGRTSGSDWYEVFTRTRAGKGWVSITVSSVQGAGCGALPITSSSDLISNPIPSAPVVTNCPAAYVGYQTPRLAVGARARVTNVIPILRLRNTPQALSDNSNLVLEINTQEIVDVISGPVCESGIARVWWQVLYNGVYGWTAESDLSATTAYYLEPLVRAPGRRFAEDIATAEIGRLEAGSAVLDIAFSTDGAQLLAINGADTFVRAFDTVTGNNLDNLYLNNTGAPLTHVLAGNTVVTVDVNSLISVWASDGTLQGTYSPSFTTISTTAIALSSDENKMAVGGCVEASLEGCVSSTASVVWLTGNSEAGITLADAFISSLAYHPTENHVLLGLKSGGVLLWDLDSSDAPQQIIATTQTNAIAYNPSGTIIAVASCVGAVDDMGICDSTELALYDATTYEKLGVLAGHADGVTITELTFSPDGSLLASGGADNQVIVWDVVNIKENNRFTGYSFGVSSLAFSPDGRLLVTGDNIGNVVLLNPE
ncbi:MAG: SH3 domain-containing protein [Anaerolineae bacterium]|nr:SH3 domain-containing protein [Anaerolineae bacterium]